MTEDEEFAALKQRLNMKEQEYEQINHPNGVTTWKTKPKKQPDALRLADEIEWIAAGKAGKETAAELRRLHALNQELLKALKKMESALKCCFGPHKAEEGDRHRALATARAAIAKAQGASNE